MNKIFYFLFILSIPLYSQIKFKFDGQLMGQSNLTHQKTPLHLLELDTLPVLNFNTKSDSTCLPFLLRFQGI